MVLCSYDFSCANSHSNNYICPQAPPHGTTHLKPTPPPPLSDSSSAPFPLANTPCKFGSVTVGAIMWA
ncbi:hypothetical protein AWENTII_012046 [Aspergillus wentii]